jgi:hypothetical protein
MRYFIYSAEQATSHTKTIGAICSYDSESGPVRFTEQNDSGKSHFKDADVVGSFADDNIPNVNAVITESIIYEAEMRATIMERRERGRGRTFTP